ncbi:hypothetical protein GGI1_06230 [Acidithiobacillus sp. GGI-221]|nr:hypothetical protein GGI1_06230 [Acidithiobacillus sp. GGI-221]
MGARKHGIARTAVILPVFHRLRIDRAGFPLLERIVFACLQALFLLIPGNIQVNFKKWIPERTSMPS